MKQAGLSVVAVWVAAGLGLMVCSRTAQAAKPAVESDKPLAETVEMTSTTAPEAQPTSSPAPKAGPAEMPKQEMHEPAIPEAEPTFELPCGFVPMEGLTQDDYIDGWPRYIVCKKDGSVMALVTGRTFAIGSPQEPNEMPVHQAKVDTFYIDVAEVDNAKFNRFVDKLKGGSVLKDHPQLANKELSTATPHCWVSRNWEPSFASSVKSSPSNLPSYVQIEPEFFKDYWTPGVNDSHPARGVNFWEAWYYCRWVGKDLPTEAEWELAAKGGEDRLYPWGDIEPDSQHLYCNYGSEHPAEDGYRYAAPVTAFEAGRSAYGCYSMAGNVWEWCKDFYDATHYSAGEGTGKTINNPAGPPLGDKRVIRGGAYTSTIYECRTTARKATRQNYHGMNIGFRGVLRIR